MKRVVFLLVLFAACVLAMSVLWAKRVSALTHECGAVVIEDGGRLFCECGKEFH